MRRIYQVVLISFSLFLALTLHAQSTEEYKTTQKQIEALIQSKKSIDTQILLLRKKITKLPKPVWKYKGNATFNLGQSILGDYWSRGGSSNVNVQITTRFEAMYSKNRHSWDNVIDAKIGFIENFDLKNGTNQPLMKNADLFQIFTEYLYDLHSHDLKLGVEINFLTQFAKTFDLRDPEHLISDFFAPAILDIAPGIEWDPEPSIKFFFAPAMGRMTFVTNDTIISRVAENRFGNDVNQTFRSEVGAKADIIFEKEVLKNLVIRSRAQLFNNWSRPQAKLDALYSNRINIDVNWQTDVFYKLTKNIAINFGFHAIYDDDVRVLVTNTSNPDGKEAKWQLRQSLGFGFVAGF